MGNLRMEVPVLVLVLWVSVASSLDIEKMHRIGNTTVMSSSSILEYVQRKAAEMISGGDSNQQEDELSMMMDNMSIEQL